MFDMLQRPVEEADLQSRAVNISQVLHQLQTPPCMQMTSGSAFLTQQQQAAAASALQSTVVRDSMNEIRGTPVCLVVRSTVSQSSTDVGVFMSTVLYAIVLFLC
jgi:hypothetical protein